MRRTWMTLALVAGMALGGAIVTNDPGDAGADPLDGASIEVGAKAPGFRLNDQHGKAVSLKSAMKQGWVALAFYPKSATPG